VHKPPPLAAIAPIVRGVCSEKDQATEGAWRRLVLDFRGGDGVIGFLDNKDLPRLSEAGVITPDQTIRTKNWPLVLPRPEPEKLMEFAQAARDGGNAFTKRYRDYFSRHNKRSGGQKRPLDPLPRVVLVPGLGLFGLGRSKADAVIAA